MFSRRNRYYYYYYCDYYYYYHCNNVIVFKSKKASAVSSCAKCTLFIVVVFVFQIQSYYKAAMFNVLIARIIMFITSLTRPLLKR